jgi:hypothetical protein
LNFSEKPEKNTLIDGAPGMTGKGVGFNIKTGEVYINEKKIKKFDLYSEIQELYENEDSANTSQNIDFTGNFYGIGINVSKKQLFFSFNGRIINTLDFKALGEIMFVTHEMKVQELIEKDENLEDKHELEDFTDQLELDNKTSTKIKKLTNFKLQWKDFVYPVLYIDNMCKVNWNIGALPFKVKDPMGSGIIGMIKEE